MNWAGLLLHQPHYEVAAQQGWDPAAEGVYIAWLWYGSPGSRYGIRPTRRVVEVNGEPTPDLDSFLAVIQDLPDQAAVRVSMKTLDGRDMVQSLELDYQYWPTQVLELEDGVWSRRLLDPKE